jgi:hypothetical protein
MSNLTYLNDASVLHNLKQRYYAKLIYVRLRVRQPGDTPSAPPCWGTGRALSGFVFLPSSRAFFTAPTLKRAAGRRSKRQDASRDILQASPVSSLASRPSSSAMKNSPGCAKILSPGAPISRGRDNFFVHYRRLSILREKTLSSALGIPFRGLHGFFLSFFFLFFYFCLTYVVIIDPH